MLYFQIKWTPLCRVHPCSKLLVVSCTHKKFRHWSLVFKFSVIVPPLISLLYHPHLSQGVLPSELIFVLSHSLPLLLPTAQKRHLIPERVTSPILLLLTLLIHLTDLLLFPSSSRPPHEHLYLTNPQGFPLGRLSWIPSLSFSGPHPSSTPVNWPLFFGAQP